MKILMLTDMPPCKNYTAGLVLDQLCRFLPKGSVACYAIVNPLLQDAKLSEDLSWIPIEYHNKPREDWRILHVSKWFINNPVSFVAETYKSLFTTGGIADNVANFGRRFGADLLWCVLQGQTEIGLALPVSKKLGVPLVVQVWDPPYFWLDSHGVDGFSSKLILNKFADVLRASDGVAAASWAMAEKYSIDYAARTTPIMPCMDSRLALGPKDKINDNGDFIIGAAGKVYPYEVWQALFDALDSVDWNICGRKVKVRVLANNAAFRAKGAAHIEFMGWRPQNETIRLLSEADVLYCPYWFDPYYETVVKLSFPAKLTTFLAAGRPVFFHGPNHASPARFLEENGAGMLCDSLDSRNIIGALSRLVSDNSLYADIARNGRAAFDRYLTLKNMRKNFAELLKIDEDFFVEDKDIK